MAMNKFSRISSILANRTYFTYSNQISQPLERTPPYVEARKAVECIKSGKVVKARAINCREIFGSPARRKGLNNPSSSPL
jgi:hypothetical protein